MSAKPKSAPKPKAVNPASHRLIAQLGQAYAEQLQALATEACAIDGVDPKAFQVDVSTMTYVERKKS